MWAITSYFNPAGYRRRLSNYKIFRANLAAPLVAVELSFDGRFELGKDDADILVQISGGAALWQKERLLNVAIRSVPRDTKNIAWLDCDVIFERTDWMQEAERKLADTNIVQLFSHVVDLGPDGYRADVPLHELRPTGQGIVSAIKAGGPGQLDAAVETGKNVRQPFPTGMGWAARRDILERHGLYDALIIGGGDRAIVHAMHGQFEVPLLKLNKRRHDHYLSWARAYHEKAAGTIDYVPGRIFHLWHGEFRNRNSRGRQGLLAGFDFDPDADLRIGANGAWQWARPRPDLEELLRQYFISRAEDD